MKIENNQIRIRNFTMEDLPLMLKWLTDDRMLADGEKLVLISKIFYTKLVKPAAQKVISND